MLINNAFNFADYVSTLSEAQLANLLKQKLPQFAVICCECFGIAQLVNIETILEVVRSGDIEILNCYLCQDCYQDLRETIAREQKQQAELRRKIRLVEGEAGWN